jgi:hypothetical protein
MHGARVVLNRSARLERAALSAIALGQAHGQMKRAEPLEFRRRDTPAEAPNDAPAFHEYERVRIEIERQAFEPEADGERAPVARLGVDDLDVVHRARIPMYELDGCAVLTLLAFLRQ